MTIEAIPPVTGPDTDYIDSYRVITLTQAHHDGSMSVRTWYLEAHDAEHFTAMLGAPQEATLVPTETVEVLAQINEGLPTVGGDFFS